MDWRIDIEVEASEAGTVIIGRLSRLGWLRLHADGRRIRVRPARRGHGEALPRMLAEIAAHYPHTVSMEAAHADKPATLRQHLDHWLTCRRCDAFAILSYGDRRQTGRTVFCFRHADDALHFGRRFL